MVRQLPAIINPTSSTSIIFPFLYINTLKFFFCNAVRNRSIHDVLNKKIDKQEVYKIKFYTQSVWYRIFEASLI